VMAVVRAARAMVAAFMRSVSPYLLPEDMPQIATPATAFFGGSGRFGWERYGSGPRRA